MTFLHRLVNLLAPPACAVCGQRLDSREEVLCTRCNLRLPRTGFAETAYENEMGTRFWLRFAVERSAALFYYQPHSRSARPVYQLKYGFRPDHGTRLGRLCAKEMAVSGFFGGIEAIVPVPLTPKRQRQRGYNQALLIAQGISRETGIPILPKCLRRIHFHGSQTRQDPTQRTGNVEGAFLLARPEQAHGKHLLLVDDVVTTGATVCACAEELMKAGDVRISVLSLGFTLT